MNDESILIITEYSDYSSSLVMQWLIFKKEQVVRINSEEENVFFQSIYIGLTESELLFSSESTILNNLSLKEKKIWFRRGVLKFLSKEFILNDFNDNSVFVNEQNRIKTINHLNDEFSNLKLGIYNYIDRYNYSMSIPISYQANKLISLLNAKECELMIPETLVTTSKKEVCMFLTKYKDVVTKGIQEASTIKTTNNYETTYTSLFTADNLKELSDYFFPSLFQVKIEKEIEIRVFIFNQLVFSMAIFSQNDKQTEIDYRRYNFKKPNRYVPYKIPVDLKNKIMKFMKKMNLKTGSIDLILSKENKYYFLEVNPVGQFSFLSQECNYYIEKEIANQLIKTNEK